MSEAAASANPQGESSRAAERVGTARAACGKATTRVYRRVRTRPDVLRSRLGSLRKLSLACDASGVTIALTARGADGKRHTCHFSDRLTVVELREGVRRAIENTELRLKRLEESGAQPKPARAP